MNPGETRHNDHAGLLLFSIALGSIAQTLTPPQPLLQQWLAGLLNGALNVEQTKFLNWADLDFILGTTTKSPALQRTTLKALATPDNLASLFRWNHQQVQQAAPQSGSTDYYLDPHTQHYTGMQACSNVPPATGCLAHQFAVAPSGSAGLGSRRGREVLFTFD